MQRGGTPVVFPTIQILPPDSWDGCDRALQGLYMYDGMIFTSTNGVVFFSRRCTEKSISKADLQSKQIFVIGEKPKQAIEQAG
ncbi:MAG TPA: uroporphyrinogen-III synthase, partial [Bacteroidota bacterium]|nr:uroporphyrinogen-III synthase [Bacteroidota bacterium]